MALAPLPACHHVHIVQPLTTLVNNIFTRVSGCLQSGHYVSPLQSGHPGESGDKADNDHISTFPKTKVLLVFHDFLIRDWCVSEPRDPGQIKSATISQDLERPGAEILALVSCVGCNYFALQVGTRAEPCLNHYKRPRAEQPSWYGSFVSFSSASTIKLKYQAPHLRLFQFELSLSLLILWI